MHPNKNAAGLISSHFTSFPVWVTEGLNAVLVSFILLFHTKAHFARNVPKKVLDEAVVKSGRSVKTSG